MQQTITIQFKQHKKYTILYKLQKKNMDEGCNHIVFMPVAHF